MPHVLLVFLALSLFPPQASAVEPPREKEKWVALETADFLIFSNADAKHTANVAADLLRMRDTIGKITQLKVRSALPTRVYIFHNERSFAPYRDALLNRRNATNVTGVFLGGEEGNFILLQGDAAGIDRVVYHELTHFFVKNTIAGLPLWLHEGIAEYYSTFAVKGDEVSLGLPVTDHVTWLRNEPLIPLAQLFAIDEKSREYNEGMRQGVYYAQSWALMHYLLVGNPERRGQLPKFLDLLVQNKPIDESFRTAFNTTFEEMERELRAYVRKPTMQYRRYTLEELNTPTVPAPQPMPRDELLYRLGDLLARASGGRGFADAERFLTEALKVNERHAGAYADLALLHDEQGRPAEAAAAFEKAVLLGAKDATVYITYGATLLQNLVPSVNAGRPASAAEVAKPRALFQKATELAPANARAWAGLGSTYAITDGDPHAGIVALEKSLALAPGQEDVAFQLVQLYSRAARREDAARLVETVIARAGDPEQLAHAREAVVLADLRRAEKLLRENKPSEAAPLLQSVGASTTNPQLKAHVAKVLGAISAEEKAKRQVDEVNVAIDLANRRKFKDAIAKLDALIPQIEDAELLANAKKLRAELAKAQ